MTATRRVERLLGDLVALPEGVQREVARSIAVVLDASGDALVRILEIAEEHGAVDEMLADPDVRGLLELHGLVPDPSTPVEIGRRPIQRCELCARPVDADHPHVADLEDRRMLCACRPCELLFRDGTGGRYRSVPGRRIHLGALADPPAWVTDIPVGFAFCIRSGATGRTSVFYPGPAGATESELDAGDLDDLLAGAVGPSGPSGPSGPIGSAGSSGVDVADDVEAVLLHATGDGFDAWVVPIDICYELTGRLRDEGPGSAAGAAAEFLARL